MYRDLFSKTRNPQPTHVGPPPGSDFEGTVDYMKDALKCYLDTEFTDEIHESNQLLRSDISTLVCQGQAVGIDIEEIESGRELDEGLVIDVRFENTTNNELKRSLKLNSFGDCLNQKGFLVLRSQTSTYDDIMIVIKRKEYNSMQIIVSCTKKELLDKIDQDYYYYLCKHICMVPYERCIKLYGNFDYLVQSNKLIKSIFTYLSDDNILEDQSRRTKLPMEIYDKLRPLDGSQKFAVANSILCNNFHLIHGPPGTGKSDALCVLIDCLIHLGHKVLVTSESNAAIDNLLSRFAKTEYCQTPQNLNYVLRIGKRYNVSKENFKFLERIGRDHRGRPMAPVGLKDAKVVFSTLCTTYSADFFMSFRDKEPNFDYVILEEAGMSNQIYNLMAATFGKKLILAGDHHQLPPVIKSKDAKFKDFLRRSIFQQLIEKAAVRNNESISTMLTVQYRMAEEIIRPSSKYFYQDKVESAEENKRISMLDCEEDETPIVFKGPLLQGVSRLMWIQHDGQEETVKKGTSIINNHEVLIIIKLLAELLKAGVHPQDLGIIMPYNAQKDQLLKIVDQKTNLKDDLREVLMGAVELFQGNEKDVIIYATTRCNHKGDAGFLMEERKHNVAITRAKKLLIVIGNFQTLINGKKDFNTGKVSSFLLNVFKHISAHGKMIQIENGSIDKYSDISKPAFYEEKKPACSEDEAENEKILLEEKLMEMFETGTQKSVKHFSPEPITFKKISSIKDDDNFFNENLKDLKHEYICRADRRKSRSPDLADRQRQRSINNDLFPKTNKQPLFQAPISPLNKFTMGKQPEAQLQLSAPKESLMDRLKRYQLS
jgi:hypothetical protein